MADQRSIALLLERAKAALSLRQYDEAQAHVDAVLEIDPRNREAKRVQRFVVLASGKAPPAENRTTANRVGGRKVKSARGSSTTRQTAQLSKAGVTRKPRSKAGPKEDSRLRLARAAYEAKDYEGALGHLDALLRDSPSNEEAQRFKRFAELALKRASGSDDGADARKTRELRSSKMLRPRSSRSKESK